MSEKDKNEKDQFSDLLRYRRNKMTDKEKNAFERGLEKDPFAEEASEGIEEIESGLAEEDILKLRKQVKKRALRKKIVLRYRIAASVAVLMIISSIFIIVDNRRPSGEIAYAPVQAPLEDLQTTPEQIKPPDMIESKGPVDIIPEKSIKTPGETQKPESRSAENDVRKEEVISADNQDAVIIAEVKEKENEIAGKRVMTPKSVLVKETKGVEYEKEDTVTDYIPPRPVNGRADFDIYIKNNIRRPDTATTGQRVVVVLNFKVNTDGKIDSVRVMRSPGKIFSDEAIRLIREGPAWEPAEENGKVINDEVRIRIVFK